ncbi:hypothetical protein SO802_014800 [Lithocarpus litseifolius]|uniref:Uncharacterized protein n=1 Tax=Lithocarpus litseifolius TaxID=425828 RepID=A0AAW2CSM1_9ROSI
MTLKAKSSDTDESSDDEDSRMKSYITKQFKIFMKNANAKGFDKDRRQSSSSQSKSQDKGKRMLGMVVSTLFPQDPKDVDEEEEFVESKFEKMDEQDDIHTAYAKVYKVSKKHEKLYRAQLERTSSAKLDEMLSLQKSAFNQTKFYYDFSSPSIASISTTVFVPVNNVEIENNDVKNEFASENTDKGKSILGAPLKLDKKEVKNPRAKKGNAQKPKQKK